MTDIIAIITLISSILSPLVIAFAYAIRKIKKSSCLNCCSIDSTGENSPIKTNDI